MLRFVPWVIGVIVIVAMGVAWQESRDESPVERFVDKVRYGDEGPVERAGRKIDEAIDETAKELRDD